MKKKILSLALVVAMLASMLVFAPTAGATETQATLAFGKAAGAAGDTVAVDLTVTTAALAGVQFLLDYDESKLTFKGIDWTTTVDGIPADLSGEKENYGVFFDNGTCDKVLSWATGIGVGAIDLSAGVVLATLRFTINADAPVGDAYVNFIPSGGISNKVNYGSASYTSEQIEFVNGAVTVLPKGYIDLSAGVTRDFTASVTGKITAYNGSSTGTVVIPENGLRNGTEKALKAIAGEALYGTPFTTLVIPEHITSIEEGAIYDPAVDTLKVIVLGASTTFAAAAVIIEESSCVVTICGYAGSTAETYAQSEGYDFEALDLCSLTASDASYLVPANTEIAAPGVVTTDDGKVVVGWKDGEKTYAPGEAMTLTGDTTLTPVTIDAIKMNTGVGFKMGAEIDKCQMRFTTDMTVADYNTLASLGTVTVGTLITPAAYVSMAGDLTFEALDALSTANGGVPTYINVPAGGYFKINQEETVYTFAGSLAGFKNENIDLPYAAAFYATVELADGSSFTVYSAFDFGANRTVNDSITAMTNVEGGLTNTEANTLRDLIAAN